MELGKHVVDKTILDVNGYRAGKVDDLVLAETDSTEDDGLPPLNVVSLVTGPLALARNYPTPVAWLARRVYQALGIGKPRPIEVAWDQVVAIDVVVHVDLDREQSELRVVSQAAADRFIARLPGA